MAGGGEDPWSCLVFVLPTQSFLSWGSWWWLEWVILAQVGRNGWSVLDSWSISMWHNFPVWAMSIACLVRPLSYIFYLFRDTLLAHIWHGQTNTSNYTIWLFDWAYQIWSSEVSQKRSSKMWLRRRDITSLRRCSSSCNSLRGMICPIHRDGITALTLKCLKCHYGKSAQHFFQS